MNLKATYNKIAEDWYKNHQDDLWLVEGTDKFISYFKKGDTILDAGCGAGMKAKYFTERGLKVVGIVYRKNC